MLESRDDEGAFCGSDVYNFFDDDGGFEVETIGPNGCSSQFTTQQTLGVFNGGEYFLTGEVNIRVPTLLGVQYDGFDAANPDVDNGRLQTYLGGEAAAQTSLIAYNDPETNSGPYPPGETVFDFDRPYSIGQAPINTSAGTEVSMFERRMGARPRVRGKGLRSGGGTTSPLRPPLVRPPRNES